MMATAKKSSSGKGKGLAAEVQPSPDLSADIDLAATLLIALWRVEGNLEHAVIERRGCAVRVHTLRKSDAAIEASVGSFGPASLLVAMLVAPFSLDGENVVLHFDADVILFQSRKIAGHD